MATPGKAQWSDPKRQGDLLEALITVGDIPTSFSPEQRDAVVAFLHARGHTEIKWNGLR